ncbi:E3 ubiquitin-protein ligase TRAF7-like [Elysia marginata]|uniref:E3 ubiquitin-protein ligase TRAF7-like n=1 Tax=Elysia marginata TaxID=1093978 RepID=A0AAV4IP62_9GAST|nr:E3 ubiquitin-protein ligase TRAF7-like [Elysia marginata]
MGYSLLRFLGPVDQHLRCPICSHALESPVLTPCGHTFCHPCLLTWLHESSPPDMYNTPSHTRAFSDDGSGSLRDSRVTNHQLDSQYTSFGENQPQSSALSDVHEGVGRAHHWRNSQSGTQPDPTNERQRDQSGTCPECRSSVCPGELSQVICVRNLVLSLEVRCEHSDRGCSATFPLERSDHHLQTCEFVPVTCLGCEQQMNRSQLKSHQQTCVALRRVLQMDDLGESDESGRDARNDCHRETDNDHGVLMRGSQEVQAGPWLETYDSSFDLMYRNAVRERSSTLAYRRNLCTATSRFTARPSDTISRACDKRDTDFDPSSPSSFDLERSKTGRNVGRTAASPTASEDLYTSGTNIDCLALSRLGTNISTTTRAHSPTRRNQTWQPSSQASVALAQASCAAQVSRLLTRIGALETQVGKLLDDLHEANSKNSELNIEYRRIQKELLVCRRDQAAQTTTDACPKLFVNSETRQLIEIDIGQLSATLAQHLLAKPSYIDSTVVFRQLRSCYVENFLSGSASDRQRNVLHDLHVLLATAYASNWFSQAQRTSLGLWLQHVLLTSGHRRVDVNHS